MKFTSNFKGTVFWRTFSRGDTVYLAGLRQGTANEGGTVEYDNPTGFFQMELKRGGLFGQTLVAAGHVYADDDEYILTEAGTFLSIDEAAAVTVGGIQVQPAGAHVFQFFQQGSTDSSVKMTSTITQTTTQTGSLQSTVTSEASDETDAQVGAKESASAGDGLKLGVEMSQQVSSKVESKISKAISTTLGVSVVTASTYSEEQPITLPANKLTSVETSWQRKYVTGSVVLGALTFTFEATLGFLSSRADLNWDSANDLPPELEAAYMAQNPGYLPPVDLHDGAVLREQDSPPVNVIFGGAKFWIPTGEVLNRLYGGWANVIVVPDGSLSPVPSTPRDGTILREDTHAEVWLIQDGTKRHITSPDVLSRYGGWAAVDIVPDNGTTTFPIGIPIT